MAKKFSYNNIISNFLVFLAPRDVWGDISINIHHVASQVGEECYLACRMMRRPATPAAPAAPAEEWIELNLIE